MEAPARLALRAAVLLWLLPAACAPSPGDPRGALPIIAWEEADQYYGRKVVVEGTAVAARNTGRACFLNFHRNWKRYFTAVIFAGDFDRFPAPPERMYSGRRVRVSGCVREYPGKPEIIVQSPDPIRTLE